MVAQETSWTGDTTATGAARTPGAPTYVSHGSDQITFLIDQNENGLGCDWAIEVEENGVSLGYMVSGTRTLDAVKTNPSPVEDGDFQTITTWGDNVTITGLSSSLRYRFRTYVRNELDLPSGGTVGAWSVYMNTDQNIDWSQWTSTDSYDVTSGNTVASSVSLTRTSRGVKVSFTLTNKDATASSVDVEYSKDSVTYSTATQVTADASVDAFAIDKTAKTITSSGATAGTFSKFTAGDTVTIGGSEDAGNDGTYVIDTVTSKIMTLTTVLDADNAEDSTMLITGGNNIDSLAAAAAGTTHTFIWDTGDDLGSSYYGSSIGIQITPYDDVSQGGSTDTAVTSTGNTVNNIPLAPTTFTEIREVSWDKDTTPEFIAEMSDIVCGDELFFAISFTDAAGTETIYESDDTVDGWWYEQDRDDAAGSTTPGVTTNWTAMTLDGVDKQYVPPIYQGQEEKTTRNRVRYILPAGNALTANTLYTVKMKQGERHG